MLDEAFARCNAAQDGMFTKEDFKNFVIDMNTEAARNNIKNRELTDEWVDMAWAGFNGFKADTDGVTKEDLYYVLEQIGM